MGFKKSILVVFLFISMLTFAQEVLPKNPKSKNYTLITVGQEIKYSNPNASENKVSTNYIKANAETPKSKNYTLITIGQEIKYSNPNSKPLENKGNNGYVKTNTNNHVKASPKRVKSKKHTLITVGQEIKYSNPNTIIEDVIETTIIKTAANNYNKEVVINEEVTEVYSSSNVSNNTIPTSKYTLIILDGRKAYMDVFTGGILNYKPSSYKSSSYNRPTTSSVYTNTTTNNEYTVRRGDSLSIIAKKFKTTVRALKEMNNLTSNMILIGQKLRVN